MNRATAILLAAVLVLGIVFAGPADARAIGTWRAASGNAAVPIMASDPHPSSAPQANPFPVGPDTAIFTLLSGCLQQPCWVRVVEYQRQISGFARTGYGAAWNTACGCKLVKQGGRQQLAVLRSLPGSLSALSPPGLIPRL